jgi:hypothetical protein
MKKLFSLLALIAVLAAFPAAGAISDRAAITAAHKVETYVYICDSRTAYAYHSSDHCRGLSNCKHTILKVTLSDAVNKYDRKPCKICERSSGR